MAEQSGKELVGEIEIDGKQHPVEAGTLTLRLGAPGQAARGGSLGMQVSETISFSGGNLTISVTVRFEGTTTTTTTTSGGGETTTTTTTSDSSGSSTTIKITKP